MVGYQALGGNQRIFAAVVIRVVADARAQLVKVRRAIQRYRNNIRLPYLEQDRIGPSFPCGLRQMIEHSTSNTSMLEIRMYTQIQYMRLGAVEHHDAVGNNDTVILVYPAAVADSQTVAEYSERPWMLVGCDLYIDDPAQIVTGHFSNSVTSLHA